MRRIGIAVAEAVAWLLVPLVAFCLVAGTLLIPREGLGAEWTSDWGWEPPSPFGDWLLGIGVALGLLAFGLSLVWFALWAHSIGVSRRSPSDSLMTSLASVFCAGSAIIALWTLAVHLDEWLEYAVGTRSEPTRDTLVTPSLVSETVGLACLAVVAGSGAVALVGWGRRRRALGTPAPSKS